MPLLKAGLCPALTQKAVSCLKQIGMANVIDFVTADLEEVAQKSGISYKDLLAIERVVLAQYGAFPVNGADLYADVISSVAILSTGCQTLDELLDGGLYTAEVTEVMGLAASGKTQLCLSVSLTVAMETHQNVLYMDTGGSFDIQRIQEMREARGVEEKEMENICYRLRCCRVFDVFELLTELEELRSSLSLQVDPFFSCLKLVVIDNVAAILAPVIGGQTTDGHGYMMHVARAIKSLAVDFAVAVLITNNVTYDELGMSKPTLGRAWRNIPNVRLEIQREAIPAATAQRKYTNHRTASLVRSTRQPVPAKTVVSLTDRGYEALSR